MEYPPVKPHHIAIHELLQEYIYDKFKGAFSHVLALAGDDPFAQLEVYYYYCDTYIHMGKVEDAKHMIEQARSVHYADTVMHTMFNLVIEARYNCYLRDSNLSDAQINQSLSILQEGSTELYYQAIRIKSSNCIYSKKFDEGIKLCNEIIQRAENLLDVKASAYTNLGIIYRMLSEYDESEINYQQALQYYQQLGYVRSVAGTYANLGNLANQRYLQNKTDKKLIETAIEYSHLALESIKPTSDVYFKTIILANLGLFYAQAGQSADGIKFGQESLEAARSSNLTSLIAGALISLGKLREGAGEYHEAYVLFEECLQHDVLPGNLQIELYHYLTRVCNHIGLSEKSFQYSMKLFELMEEYDHKTTAGAVYHNKLLQERLNQQEQELHQLQLRSVEEKMRSQATQLVSQTELLARFRDELREIIRQSPSNDPTIRAVKEKLKELPCKQIDWEKFETEFAAVHPEFTKRLYERCQTLTPMEVKMCSLLRLNLKSQEIGRLFCLSDRTVENHRFNIRRKLGLDREQSISVFLNSL